MNTKIENAHIDHSRVFDTNIYTYPVLSRRAKGISIGVNINLNKECNFACSYCQIERTSNTNKQSLPIDLHLLEKELTNMLALHAADSFQSVERFKGIDANLLQIKDICISGDGESTMHPQFAEVCALLQQVQQTLPFALKLVLITNATLLHLPKVQQGLTLLTQQRGEVWAKYDACMEHTYKTIDRSSVPLSKIKQNLELCAQLFPTRVQTLLSTQNKEDFEPNYINHYLETILHMAQHNLLEVQLYSPIRRVEDPDCKPLSPQECVEIQNRIQCALQATPVNLY